MVIPNDLNRKRSGANPQARAELLPGTPAMAGSRLFVAASRRRGYAYVVVTRQGAVVRG